MPMLSCSFKGQAGDTIRRFCWVRLQFDKIYYRRARRSVGKTGSAAVRRSATKAKFLFSMTFWPLRQFGHEKKFSFSYFLSSPLRKVAKLLIETKNTAGDEALKMKRQRF